MQKAEQNASEDIFSAKDKFSSFQIQIHTMLRFYHTRLHQIAQEMDLSVGQPLVLIVLSSRESCTQSELCSFAHVKPASMTVLLQRMEKSGLIYRKQDPNDMRSMRVHISEKGMAKNDELKAARKKMEEECLSGFSESEKIQFIAYMERINQNLKTRCDEKGRCS